MKLLTPRAAAAIWAAIVVALVLGIAGFARHSVTAQCTAVIAALLAVGWASKAGS